MGVQRWLALRIWKQSGPSVILSGLLVVTWRGLGNKIR